MKPLVLTLISAALGWAAGGSVAFKEHVIESNLPNGYALLLVDINNDKRLDVIGVSSRSKALYWYENPSWTRHALIEDRTGIVNVAAHDIDGDGIPEVAFEDEFSMIAAKSPGLVWLLKNPGDVRKPWAPTKIDALVTSHHLAFADVDGDRKKELINAPLIGAKALAPKYEDHVSLVYYRTDDWKRRMIDETMFGVLHRVRVVQWDKDPAEELLTASFDGIKLHDAAGKGGSVRWTSTLLSKGHQEEAPRAGTSDVRLGRLGSTRMLGAVEPWHGNEVVVYAEAGGKWIRRVIFDQLTEGHEVVVADFNGDGLDDIAAGDRSRGTGKTADVHVFFAQDARGEAWKHDVIDKGGLAGSGCAEGDVNGDKRTDIVCIGGSTMNVKWYENLGAAK
jgi:hypothetical protein